MIRNRMISGCLRLAALLAIVLLASCSSMINDEEGDCDYYVHFIYDYNMKWADAFAHEVNSVTLYVIDTDGNVVWKKTESGPRLAAAGYAMKVDMEPGQYTLLAWCGVENLTSFDIPDVQKMFGLTATLHRTHEVDGLAHVRGEVDRLYYGRLDNVVFGTDTYHFTMDLKKATNDIRVTLQNYDGKPVQEGMFSYSIEYANGSLDWNYDVLEDETLHYHPHHISGGLAEMESAPAKVGTRVQTEYNMEAADFTVSRLMDYREYPHISCARLVIRRTDNGEKVVDINLIDALRLGKGYYNREMSDQEYLDRQDVYTLVFFLDEGYKWLYARVYIESWYVIYQTAGL